jgi:hypothetical protein
LLAGVVGRFAAEEFGSGDCFEGRSKKAIEMKKRGTRDETDLFAVERSVAAAKQPLLLPPASPKPTPPLSTYLPTSLYLGQASLDRFYLHTYLPAQAVGWTGVGWEGTHPPTYRPACLPTYLPTYLLLENSACASSG